jgi:uncharacterized RDD family membrane protein YckC
MGSRFAGLVIDMLIVAAVSGLISWPSGAVERRHVVTCSSDGFCRESWSINFGWKVWLISLAVGALYSAVFVGRQGRTLGHRAGGIRIVDSDSGRTIGALRAGFRWVVLGFTGVFFTLGFWSPVFNDRRRGWHDLATKSIAISVH